MTNGHYICRMKRKIFRENILETGLELMFNYGYHATGIKQITDEVGIPKGSFYNHFENKEAFGIEALQFYCNRGILMHQKALEPSEVPPLVRLKMMYERIIENYATNLHFTKGCLMSNFSTELSDVNENFRSVLDNEFNQIQNIIAKTLKEAQDNNQLNFSIDVSTTAAFILNSWHGALIRMKTTASKKPLEDFKTLIFDKILN